MIATDNVRVAEDGGIFTVTIDRPPVNAMSFAMFDQLRSVLQQLAHVDRMRVVVLRTEGDRAWIAGNDVREFVDLDYGRTIDATACIRTTFNALYECPVPVIAAIDGAAVGSGLCIASLCDIRIASENAVFALPEIDVGILGGARHAFRMVGNGAARRMMFTAERISAQDALRLQMVDEVVAPDELMPAAYRLAETIARKSPNAMRLAKAAFNATESLDLQPGYERECTYSARSRLHPDASEAASAWLEKRQPAFSDHRE